RLTDLLEIKKNTVNIKKHIIVKFETKKKDILLEKTLRKITDTSLTFLVCNDCKKAFVFQVAFILIMTVYMLRKQMTLQQIVTIKLIEYPSVFYFISVYLVNLYIAIITLVFLIK
ncbi:hypothetical protein CDIK_4185, partial [Cucumispora dikerogammari]